MAGNRSRVGQVRGEHLQWIGRRDGGAEAAQEQVAGIEGGHCPQPSADATARPTSWVFAPPPMSGVRGPVAVTFSIAARIASCACG